MKEFLTRCKKAFQKKESDSVYDPAEVMKRVDSQIGRAVTRLSNR